MRQAPRDRAQERPVEEPHLLSHPTSRCWGRHRRSRTPPARSIHSSSARRPLRATTLDPTALAGSPRKRPCSTRRGGPPTRSTARSGTARHLRPTGRGARRVGRRRRPPCRPQLPPRCPGTDTRTECPDQVLGCDVCPAASLGQGVVNPNATLDGTTNCDATVPSRASVIHSAWSADAAGEHPSKGTGTGRSSHAAPHRKWVLTTVSHRVEQGTRKWSENPTAIERVLVLR